MSAKKKLIAQKALTTTIINFVENLKKKPVTALTQSYIQTVTDVLERYWNRFVDSHTEIVSLDLDIEAEEYFVSDTYGKIEDIYISTRADLMNQSLQAPGGPTSADPSASVQTSPRPIMEFSAPSPLALPSFDGKQENWESFKQRFLAFLASRPLMPSISKLQHLLDAVRGPAAERLKNITMVGSNFTVAWDRLNRRYDNPHLRLSSHLEALIQLNQVRPRNSNDLTALIDKAEVLVQALTDLEYPIDHSNHFVVHCMVRKLDLNTREDWNISREGADDFPLYNDLATFLERRAQSMEKTRTTSLPDAKPKLSHRNNPDKPTRFVISNTALTDATSKTLCSCCKAAHALYQCAKFKGLSPSDRFALCKREGNCINCLGRNHRVANCPSRKRCLACKAKHNTLLHRSQENDDPVEPPRNVEALPSTSDADSTSAFTSVIANASTRIKKALLATANVIISNNEGLSVTIRALIDPAAETSFLSSRVASLLSLPTKRVAVSVVVVGAESSGKADGEVICNLRSNFDPQFELPFSALVIKVVCQALPSSRLPAIKWPHLQNIQLADENYLIPAKIDAVLGAGIFPEILRERVIKAPPRLPGRSVDSFRLDNHRPLIC